MFFQVEVWDQRVERDGTTLLEEEDEHFLQARRAAAAQLNLALALIVLLLKREVVQRDARACVADGRDEEREGVKPHQVRHDQAP